MRRYSILLAVFMFVACQQAPEKISQVQFQWQSDLPAAQAQAASENKLLFVEFSTEWCPYCRHIEQRIMPQAEIAPRLQEMVLVHLDGDKAQTGPLMEQHKVQGYPTFIIFNPSGEELLRFSSVSSKQEFADYLTQANTITPEAKRFAEIMRLVDEEKSAEALTELHTLWASLQAQGKKQSTLGEEVLRNILELSAGEEKAELAQMAITLYPRSPRLPNYYAQVAQAFKAQSLNHKYWNKVVSIVRERLNRLEKQPEAIITMTLDEHVDLLSEAYQKLQRFEEIEPLYSEAARAAQRLIEKNGGIKHNQYLLGTTVYFYTQAHDTKGALEFLRESAKALPNYWPIHSAFGKIYALRGDFTQARESYAKAYALAEEVAKTRIALPWADVCYLQGDFQGALSVLNKAEVDLQILGNTESGRAKNMLNKIAQQKIEYDKARALRL